MSKPEEIWYRYQDVRYHPGLNEYDDPLPGPLTTEIYLVEYKVVKHTPKGVWLTAGMGSGIWVSKTARKRFAYPTREEALESLIARRERQVKILNAQLYNAHTALNVAQAMRKTGVDRLRSDDLAFILREFEGGS